MRKERFEFIPNRIELKFPNIDERFMNSVESVLSDIIWGWEYFDESHLHWHDRLRVDFLGHLESSMRDVRHSCFEIQFDCDRCRGPRNDFEKACLGHLHLYAAVARSSLRCLHRLKVHLDTTDCLPEEANHALDESLRSFRYVYDAMMAHLDRSSIASERYFEWYSTKLTGAITGDYEPTEILTAIGKRIQQAEQMIRGSLIWGKEHELALFGILRLIATMRHFRRLGIVFPPPLLPKRDVCFNRIESAASTRLGLNGLIRTALEIVHDAIDFGDEIESGRKAARNLSAAYCELQRLCASGVPVDPLDLGHGGTRLWFPRAC
jgi:hypothetical protein